MGDTIIIEHSKRTDAAYNGPELVYLLGPDAVRVRKMPPVKFAKTKWVQDPATGGSRSSRWASTERANSR